ncbi:MAG: efflux RND transporter periplasmic adaptor subunit [Phycisphaerales bacterium JB040]
MSDEQNTPKSGERAGSKGGRGRAARVAVGVARGLLPLLFIGGGVYVAFWFNTSGGGVSTNNGERAEAARPVETVAVRPGDHPVAVRAMGSVRPAREAVIRPRVTGMVEWQHESFVPGGFIPGGRVMLELDRADYERLLTQRESELARAEAALKIELGDQAVAREELELLGIDIPEINRELILRIPQVNQAQAEVDSATAAVERARLDLDRTSIRAPFDGTVVTRSVTIGNNVSAGDELATFVGSDEYWVELTVPPSSLRWLQFPSEAGERASAAVIRNPAAWGPGQTRDGTLKQLVSQLDPETRLARVIVSVPDPGAREIPGVDTPVLLLDAFVDVELAGRVLPGSITLDRQLVREGDVVWVMGADDRLEIKPVEIAYRGRDVAYVVSGLDPGDRVVRTNLQAPVRGMLLREAGEDTTGGQGEGTEPEPDGPHDGADGDTGVLAGGENPGASGGAETGGGDD